MHLQHVWWVLWLDDHCFERTSTVARKVNVHMRMTTSKMMCVMSFYRFNSDWQGAWTSNHMFSHAVAHYNCSKRCFRHNMANKAVSCKWLWKERFKHFWRCYEGFQSFCERATNQPTKQTDKQAKSKSMLNVKQEAGLVKFLGQTTDKSVLRDSFLSPCFHSCFLCCCFLFFFPFSRLT